MSRWLVSCERGVPDSVALATPRRVALDPWGSVPALPELVGLFPTRASAAQVVLDVDDGADFWKIGAHLGWESWTAEPEGTWTRWRLLPMEPGLDVTPVPPGVDPGWMLDEAQWRGRPLDPLVALAAGDEAAMRKAVLEHSRRVALASGNDELADDITVELTRLDVEGDGRG